MSFRIRTVQVTVSFLFCISLSLVILFDTGFAIPGILAVCAHEGAHLFAMVCFGVGIRAVRLEGFGIIIEKESAVLGIGKQAMIAGAGSAANFALGAISIFSFKYFSILPAKDFFAINFALGALQLLPIIGLDGAELLLLFIAWAFERKNGLKSVKIASFATCGLLLIAGVIICAKVRFNPSLLLFPIVLFVHSLAAANKD